MNGARLLQIIVSLAALVAVSLGMGTYTHAEFTSIHEMGTTIAPWSKTLEEFPCWFDALLCKSLSRKFLHECLSGSTGQFTCLTYTFHVSIC